MGGLLESSCILQTCISLEPNIMMDKGGSLEFNQSHLGIELPKTPIPIYGERTPKVFARSFNPPIYHPSYPAREEVRKSNYSRRKDQAKNEGFYTPNTEPYREIGGPLILDVRRLTLLSLTQSTAIGGARDDISSAEEHDNQSPVANRGGGIGAKEDAVSFITEASNEQRLRLYRLKHTGEVMNVKKEAKAMQWMSRFASNGQPIFSLLDRIEEFRTMAKYGPYAQVKRNKTPKSAHDSSISAISSVEPRSPSPVLQMVNPDSESSSDENDSNTDGRSRGKAMLSKQFQEFPRPYSAAHNRIGTPAPSKAALEHLYRQLCALCWLLDAVANTDPNTTVCPIVESWNLQSLNNMKINKQETLQRNNTIDSNWTSFVSQHPHGTTGLASRRSNFRTGRTKLGHTGGLAPSIISDGLNESLDLTLGDLANGGMTDRVPPTVIETPSSIAPLPTTQVADTSQQSVPMQQGSDSASNDAATTTSGQHPPANAVSLVVPAPQSETQSAIGRGSVSARDEDVRSKTPISMRNSAYQKGSSRQKGAASALSRTSSALTGDRKSAPGPAVDYRRMLRDRDFLTIKLREVELDIEREERYHAFQRSAHRSKNENTDPSSRNADSGISKDLLEFTSRAPSARYHSLAARSQNRFKSATEEQGLIVSDTLHQMGSRRMELLRMKFQSLEGSSGGMLSTLGQKRRHVAETFDRAARRLRAKTAAAERQRRMAADKASEEKKRDWLGALRSCLPSQFMEDWRFRKIIERLEQYAGLRPNQTTDLDVFLNTLKMLRPFEICDPDVAAAVEFCRERILRFPESEFEDFFRKNFPTVQRPDKQMVMKNKTK